LRSAGIGAGGLAPPRLVFAQSKKPIHFTLPWVAEGSNLFTFVAKGMGFWDKLGLDVDTARGSGSLAAVQAIGEGRFDFGMATPSIAVLQTIPGLPTMPLAACAYDATMGVGVLNGRPIKTTKDLGMARRLSRDVATSRHPNDRGLNLKRVVGGAAR